MGLLCARGITAPKAILRLFLLYKQSLRKGETMPRPHSTLFGTFVLWARHQVHRQIPNMTEEIRTYFIFVLIPLSSHVTGHGHLKVLIIAPTNGYPLHLIQFLSMILRHPHHLPVFDQPNWAFHHGVAVVFSRSNLKVWKKRIGLWQPLLHIFG